jgi:uncharacterized Ntn-hydrolase superfamily protein
MTYSIVAREGSTGQIGVAVQSHFLGVGRLVAWAEAGVGAVATQSVVEPAFGPRGLDALRAGRDAGAVVAELLAADEQRESRQLAVVDASGRVAAHTGERCIAAAGDRQGDGVSAQANIMARATVWDAMVEAYERADGDLAARLMAALEAAEGEGGDLRGRQSAALVVVAAEAAGNPLADRPFDLRVDDHPDPLGELARLLALTRAYAHVDEGDELAARGDADAALREYAAAHAAEPDNMELAFWHGAALAAEGREEEARPLIARATAAHEGWAELLRRLPSSGLFPDDRDLIERLLGPGGAG